MQFAHQLFQEVAFAARVLAEQPEPELVHVEWRAAAIAPGVHALLDTLGRGERLPELPATGWEETTLVAAAMTLDADGFVRDLMAPNLPLAGRCAVAPGVTVRDTLRAELRAALVARSRDRAADLRARIDAALALGPLGDPRFEQRTGPFGRYLLPPLVTVAGGTYRVTAGSSPESREEIEVRLPTFAMGRFAVTNAEYQCFLDAGGYEDERWWEGDAARAWRNGQGTDRAYRWMWRENWRIFRSWPDSQIPQMLEAGRVTQDDAEEWTMIRAMDATAFESWLESWLMSHGVPGGRYTRPHFFEDSAFNAPLQPVGACAGTRRAPTARGSRHRRTGPTGYPPSTSGRQRRAVRLAAAMRYDGEFDPAKGNTYETRLGRATPAGVFPEGDTPEGISDLGANTSDWTSSPWVSDAVPEVSAGAGNDASPVPRLVCGANWVTVRIRVYAAIRGRGELEWRNPVVGFRVVCVPPIK